MSKPITAFAPASIANLAVGFDILGLAFDRLGDKVTVQKADSAEITIEIPGEKSTIPKTPEQNTAGKALINMKQALGLKTGFKVTIEKGIPLASGLGGSAASAVGAVVAANQTLDTPLPTKDLYPFALAGEAVASGAPHGDNVAPCLFGGLQLIEDGGPVEIPFPKGVYLAVIHPHHQIKTSEARSVLSSSVDFKAHIQQSTHLAGFLTGCFTGNSQLIFNHTQDLVIEPQRASLIPHFDEVKIAALESGARAFSISGAGPAVFAFCKGPQEAESVVEAVTKVFKNNDISAKGWTLPGPSKGAIVL